MSHDSVPVIDIESLVKHGSGQAAVAMAIGQACRENGFFYVINHGIDWELQRRLEAQSRDFFAMPVSEKMKIEMARGGRAWRGYFPVGDELTSGKPDLKEGLYFGAELGADHPAVQSGTPLHGPNLFPVNMPIFRAAVGQYIAAMTELGHALMRGLSLSLGLPQDFFADHYTKDPLVLFRIFNYPAASSEAGEGGWGVGEHTDYGVLTILKQDHHGGLEVKARGGWISAPPIENAFVCNIGDMLDRMTGGLYRSTPHRVKNSSGQARLSFPFFFDPNFNVDVNPLPVVAGQVLRDDSNERWDKANVHAFKGTYGDYLLGKIGKVFPGLEERVLKA